MHIIKAKYPPAAPEGYFVFNFISLKKALAVHKLPHLAPDRHLLLRSGLYPAHYLRLV
jgi:hypothetical protein